MRKPRSIAAVSAVLALVGVLTAAPAADKPPITTGTLIEEMIDLRGLTYFPSPSFRTAQFSSYDRRSSLPGGPGWFANSDGFGGEPIPGFEKVLKEPAADGSGEYLIADVAGPGAVVRLWTASISGKVRLFIDDMERPLYDGPADDFFRRPYDAFPEAKDLDPSLLKRTFYQRDAAYAPFPFKDRMRIVWTGNIQEIHFYHVGVRFYEPGTEVVSFTPGDLATYKGIIDRIMAVLSDPDKNFAPRTQEPPRMFASSLAPSEKRELLSLDGPGAIEVLTLKLKAEDLTSALRQTVINVICDEFPWGQVQSPVGDLFGAAPDINPFVSLPFTVRPDGTMVCRFVMPFRRSLKLVCENFGRQTVEVEGSALAGPYDWDDARSMHFRARWRVDHDLVASNKDVQDLAFLLASGKGVYVGTTSYVLNPSPVPTSGGDWWGEGDEKVFVDGDGVPSTFGTGSEDYYNYSWSSPDIFFFPYCGQPRNDGPGNRGFVANFRWHILDPLPFQTGIRFTIELFHHERTPDLSYARIGYHYGRPGLTDDHRALRPADLRASLLQIWEPAARGGAANSEFFQAEKVVKERDGVRTVRGSLWAGGLALFWDPKAPGETRTLVFKVRESGDKSVRLTLAMTRQSGKLAVFVDGKSVLWEGGQATIDLFEPYRVQLRTFSLAKMPFSAGEHRLTLRYEGAPSAAAAPEIGIDFIWIQKE